MQRLDLHRDKGDFKPTKEELDMIKKKMDDPEFMKLWAEYAQSLSDPKYREEEAEYLRQVEREAQEGGDYSFEFIFPKPCYAVQLLQDGKGGRTYLNICECDKVEEFSETALPGSSDASWHVPVVVGQSHQEQYDGAEVHVFDCTFHPKTAGLSNRSDRFMCFLVEIAVENINAGYKHSFGFEFRRIRETNIGTPKNQTIRRKGAEPLFPRDTSPPCAAPTSSASSATAAAKPATQAKRDSGAKEPVVTITHRGEVDLTDSWNWRQSDKRVGVPKELVVAFDLPGISRASEIDVDVLGHSIVLSAGEKRYAASVALPFTVEETPAEAKFDKSKQRLVLVLRVVPPPPPTRHDDEPGAMPNDEHQSTPEVEQDVDESETQAVSCPADDSRAEALPETSANENEKETAPQVEDEPQTEVKRDDVLAEVQERVARARERRAESEITQPTVQKVQAPPESADATLSDETAGQEQPEIVDLRNRAVKAEPVVFDDEEQDPEAILAAQKKLRAARDADRAAVEMAKKMAELPLCSRHIFAID